MNALVRTLSLGGGGQKNNAEDAEPGVRGRGSEGQGSGLYLTVRWQGTGSAQAPTLASEGQLLQRITSPLPLVTPMIKKRGSQLCVLPKPLPGVRDNPH